MLVKPVTSLAFCALAVTLASSVQAATTIDAPGQSTLVVSGSVTPPPPVVVKVSTHRPRKTLKKKTLVKVVVHHGAEPAKTPVIPAAVVVTPSHTHVSRVKVVHKTKPAPSAHVKGEIMIGPKADATVVVSPGRAHHAEPATIEVKTEPAHAHGHAKVEVDVVKNVDVKPVKVSGTVKPVAEISVKEETPRATLDVAAGETKVVATVSGTAPLKGEAHAKVAPKAPCMHEGVEFVRGQEAQTFSLTRCDGSVAPLALEKLSVLARPESAPLPKSIDALAHAKGPELASGIRRMDPGLVERIQAITDHFTKTGQAKVSVISGYRPMSSGSYHATGQAMDLRIEGVANEAVVEFCKSLNDTGCGYYPNSSFVHVDVRAPGTGHVAWIDASGPGESPKYVASWPPPPDPEVKSADKSENPIDKLDHELPELPSDDHPAAPGVSAVVTAPLDVAK